MITDQTIVEVILKKKMTYGKYKSIIQDSKKKGWDIKAYQNETYSEGLKNQVKDEE